MVVVDVPLLLRLNLDTLKQLDFYGDIVAITLLAQYNNFVHRASWRGVAEQRAAAGELDFCLADFFLHAIVLRKIFLLYYIKPLKLVYFDQNDLKVCRTGWLSNDFWSEYISLNFRLTGFC